VSGLLYELHGVTLLVAVLAVRTHIVKALLAKKGLLYSVEIANRTVSLQLARSLAFKPNDASYLLQSLRLVHSLEDLVKKFIHFIIN
jgi:hypothetical protein